MARGVGSGYVLMPDGVVATNYHVIAGANEATAVFKNGKTAKVLGTLLLDEKRDIAILKIDMQSLPRLIARGCFASARRLGNCVRRAGWSLFFRQRRYRQRRADRRRIIRRRKASRHLDSKPRRPFLPVTAAAH